MCLVHLGCQMQFSLLLIAVPCCLSRHVAGMWSAERWQDRMSAQVCGCLLWTQLLIQACHSRDALLKIGTVILKSSTDWRMRAKSLQLYLTLCDPMDCSPPGSSDFPGKNTGVDCHSLFQGIFLTQGLNPGLLHFRQILFCLSHQGSPHIYIYSLFFGFLSHLGHQRALSWVPRAVQ